MLDDQTLLIRAKGKADFSELKEAQVKDLTAPELWRDQAQLLRNARALQTILGSAQWNNCNLFEHARTNALTAAVVKLDSKEKKQFEAAVRAPGSTMTSATRKTARSASSATKSTSTATSTSTRRRASWPTSTPTSKRWSPRSQHC